MDCPRPPGASPPPPKVPPKPVPDVGTGEPTITEDEAEFILKSTLYPKHRDDPNVLRFIQNYLRCRNASQAAREAGLDARSGPNLRNREDIHKCIAAFTQKMAMKYGYDANEVVERVKEFVDIDPIDVFGANGNIKRLEEMTPETRRAIKSFKFKEFYEKDPNGMPVAVGRVVEIEFHDKLKSVELLSREKDIFKQTNVVQHDITQNMRETLLESSSRAEQRIERMKAAQLAAPTAPVTEEIIDVTATEIKT